MGGTCYPGWSRPQPLYACLPYAWLSCLGRRPIDAPCPTADGGKFTVSTQQFLGVDLRPHTTPTLGRSYCLDLEQLFNFLVGLPACHHHACCLGLLGRHSMPHPVIVGMPTGDTCPGGPTYACQVGGGGACACWVGWGGTGWAFEPHHHGHHACLGVLPCSVTCHLPGGRGASHGGGGVCLPWPHYYLVTPVWSWVLLPPVPTLPTLPNLETGTGTCLWVPATL